MQRIKVDAKHDKVKLRAALDDAGHQKGQIVQQADELFVEVPDDADALQVDRLAQGHRRRLLRQACRDAKTLAELKAAVDDVLESLLG
jgi:23S rRNA C2498 (ribose-2'-O)-methylase RlmM